MAEAYPVGIPAAEAASAIRLAAAMLEVGGIPYLDGRGAKNAEAGTDFGWPLLKGNGAPTTQTAASIGQHYYDMLATSEPYEWICTGTTTAGFRWSAVGAGSGSGFAILGYYASLEELVETVVSPSAGDAYGVGNAPPYDIYVWDDISGEWINNGPLSGADGVGVPPHGQTGQALVKASADDFDTTWQNIALSGAAPTSATKADFVGQLLVVSDGAENAKIYVCTAIDDGAYTWLPVVNEIVIPPKFITSDMIGDRAISRDNLMVQNYFSPGRAINYTNSNYNLSAADTGYTLYTTDKNDESTQVTDYIINLTQAISQTIPNGTEIAIVWFFAKSVTINTTGVRMCIPEQETTMKNVSFRIFHRFGMATLKKLYGSGAGDPWTIQGMVEII